jgi:hypothetical protein
MFPKALSKIGYIEPDLSAFGDSEGIDSDANLDWGGPMFAAPITPEGTKRATSVEESKVLYSSH